MIFSFCFPTRENLKTGYFGLLMGVWLLTGCNIAGEKPKGPMEQLLINQLEATCNLDSVRFVKTVENLSNPVDTAESQTYSTLKIKREDGAVPTCQLVEELSYALANYYNEPKQRDYYLVETHGDTLIARVKPAASKRARLALQKLIFAPDSSHFRYVESVLDRSSWLYSTHIHIKARFDTLGQYLQHETTSTMKVATMKKDFKAKITGKLERS